MIGNVDTPAIVRPITNQGRIVRFVNEHDCSFATPAHNGGVWIYTIYTRREWAAAGRWDIGREYAANYREARNILGY